MPEILTLPVREMTPPSARPRPLLGIDPGQSTGLAIYHAGQLAGLETIRPHEIERTLRTLLPARVVCEDSRLQSRIWGARVKTPLGAKLATARSLGQVDAWCSLIVELCDELRITAHGISPKDKGAKLDAEAFHAVTGWEGRTNSHERDAAMVAHPYRMASRG